MENWDASTVRNFLDVDKEALIAAGAMAILHMVADTAQEASFYRSQAEETDPREIALSPLLFTPEMRDGNRRIAEQKEEMFYMLVARYQKEITLAVELTYTIGPRSPWMHSYNWKDLARNLSTDMAGKVDFKWGPLTIANLL